MASPLEQRPGGMRVYVPGFSNVYIHIGNDDDDTAGCPLIGTTANDDLGTVGNSRVAYTALYAIVAPYLIGPDAPGAWLTVTDRDAPEPWK